MKANNSYPLYPVDSHKSFYGKCYVELAEEDGAVVTYLVSYATRVLKRLSDGTIIRLWDGWSATTQRHVNSFLYHIGRPELCGKSNWYKIPTE